MPFPAGGTADAVPRLVADWLSKKWGQPVIIENPTGAAGNIGSEQAYRADPDGYTLLSAPPPPLVINQNLYKNLNFDASKFEPIIVMAQVPNGIMVNPAKVSATTVPEFIAHLKANPGKITSATQGNGTTSHLTSEMLQLMGQGEGAAHSLSRHRAGLAGSRRRQCRLHVRQSWRVAAAGGSRQAEAARRRDRRSAWPRCRTCRRSPRRLPGFESVAWYAVVAPPKTPKAITDKINADINEALRDPAIQERLKKLSAEVVGGSTEQTAKISARGSRALEQGDQGRRCEDRGISDLGNLAAVMPGLVPGIHVLATCPDQGRGWPGQARP